jgi:probable phosphoglycerate mutase
MSCSTSEAVSRATCSAGRGDTVSVALVRHGATDWTEEGRLQGRTDVPLNVRGRSQAVAVAERLAGERWDALYTSPLARAAETARIIGEAVGLTPVVETGLVERAFGARSGLTRSEQDRLFPAGRPVPGEESWTALVRRTRRALARFVCRHPGGRVIAVTHGGVIRAALHMVEAAGAEGNAGAPPSTTDVPPGGSVVLSLALTPVSGRLEVISVRAGAGATERPGWPARAGSRSPGEG